MKDDEKKDGQNEAEAGNADNPQDIPSQESNEPHTDTADGLPKSQEELDKLFEKRLKKEQKKWEKSKAEASAEEQKSGSESPDHAAELAAMKAELMEAKAQSAAARIGIKSDCIEDAVYLAVRAAQKESDGDPDEDDIKAALAQVMKKHPEWKAGGNEANKGFRVGAPQPQPDTSTKKAPVKRWNRFN